MPDSRKRRCAEVENNTALSTLFATPDPSVSKAIAVIDTVKTIGGNGGVEVTGVIDLPSTVVTPNGQGHYNDLVKIGRDVNKLGPHLGGIVNKNFQKAPDWARDPVGTKLGKKRRKSPTPGRVPGWVHADRTEAREWERFILTTTDDGKVALLSHVGYFCAEQGGGGSNCANRDSVADLDKWTPINNGDGTYSFRSHNGLYLFAKQGGGNFIAADREEIGPWEKSRLECNDEGSVAIKTVSKGLYISVQP